MIANNGPYYTQTPTYSNYYDPFEIARRYDYDRRARAISEGVKKFGKSALFLKLEKEERERKAMSDVGSRRRTAPRSTRRVDSRKMQTYEAAVAMRQLRR